jgi:hypothetical protein
MRARLISSGFLALGLAAIALPALAAQPMIPPGEMAGRERFRFIESPTDRYMRPGPHVEEPLITVQPRKSLHRKHRHRRH